MLYEFNGDAVRVIGIEQINPELITIGIVSEQELRTNRAQLGLSEQAIDECIFDTGRMHSLLNVYDEFSLGIINIVNTHDIDGALDCIGIFLRRNLYLLVDIVDVDASTQKLFDYALEHRRSGAVTLEKLIYATLEYLVHYDSQLLDDIEFQINTLEDELECSAPSEEFNTQLLDIRKKLLKLHSYYVQLVDISVELTDNDNSIFAKGALHFFRMFNQKAERLGNRTWQLRESLTQLRDAYQAQLDYKLNNIMKVFTVVATIFLPLNLIVGWYGMNFEHMPELSWQYGYAAVIALCVAIVVGCYWFFKRKKLM